MKRFAQRTGFVHFSSFSRLTFSLTLCSLLVRLFVVFVVLRATFLRLFAWYIYCFRYWRRWLTFPILRLLLALFLLKLLWCIYHYKKTTGWSRKQSRIVFRSFNRCNGANHLYYTYIYVFTAQFLLFSISVQNDIDARTKSSHHSR